MNRLLLLFVPLLLVACVSQETPTPPSKPHAPAITVVDGPATAEALTKRYNDTRRNCGNDSMPAFLCSGIIIRATIYSDKYAAWNPSPAAIAKGSVSFSYLRKDNNFQKFAWAPNDPNGFIFYPIMGMPELKSKIAILCHFPMDGWTDARRDREACGVYPGVAGSEACHQQGITTGAQWVAKYPPGTRGDRICGFDVRDELNHYAGPNFYAAMQAKWMNSGYFGEQNEMLLRVWGQNQGEKLPIQAFFYASQAGLEPARKNKQRFLAEAKINLPIIKVTLPTVPSGSATFQFIPGDQ